MAAGVTVALTLLAQSPSQTYGPAPPPPKPAISAKPSGDCADQPKPASPNEIVVCAVKPDGYRLPPEIVEARRLKKEDQRVRPRNPHETFADKSCAHVGPAGCAMGPAIDLIALAPVAAEIAARLAKGQEVGSIFKTQKAKGDYQYYLEAKKEREAKEAEAQAKAAKAKAEAAPSDPQPQVQPSAAPAH